MGVANVVGRKSARRRSATTLAALLVVIVAAFGATPAHAAFGLQSFDAILHEPAVYSGEPPALGDLVPSSQAGGHPDLTVDFSLDNSEAAIRDVDVDLPAGFAGNPQALPQCEKARFAMYECPAETQVGVMHLRSAPDAKYANGYPVYNLGTASDETAILGFDVASVPVKVEVTVHTDGDHRLRARVRNINESVVIHQQRLTLWGVPADPVHDAQRHMHPWFPPGAPSSAPRRPFLSAPPRCDAPLTANAWVRSWQGGTEDTAVSTSPTPTGCESLAFSPTLTVAPASSQAGVPSAYDVSLSVPQSDDPDGLATPHLKRAVVTLPEGVAISPPSASGLVGCPDAATAIGTAGAPSCPEASKIGTLSIDTPVLAEPLTGDIVVRTPTPDTLFRLLLVARGPGFVLKLPGEARPDPRTGQITAVFENTPQLPFSELNLHFKGGSRAPLANPQTCGTKTTTTELTSHAGLTATPTSTFDIVGCGAGMPFGPTFRAGSLNPLGGTFSPFTMTVRRPDGHQDISNLSIDMPRGLLGSIRGIAQCDEARAVAGTCGPESQIGTTTVEAGAGATPFALPGKVFLAGAYKGAPFSLSVVVRAIAGPFDLGTVVVRAPIHIDPATAEIDVPSDALPTILEGVPVRLRTINVTIDRPGFMVNPSDCSPRQVGAAIQSVPGAQAAVAYPFEAADCGRLSFQPKLRMRLTGRKQMRSNRHPGVRAAVTQKAGEARIKRAKIRLPKGLALDPNNARALCEFEDGSKPDLENHCPEGSIVGRARAVSPLLNRPLVGNVYFVKNVRTDPTTGNQIRTLPKIVAALRGEIAINLSGNSDAKGGRLVSTFASVPDAPISRFNLNIRGGSNGILVVTENRRGQIDLCDRRQIAEADMDGHNGKRHDRNVRIATPCGRSRKR